MINFKQADKIFSINNSCKFIEDFDGFIIDKTDILFERRIVEEALGREFDSDLKAFLAWAERIECGEIVSPSRFIDLNYYQDSNKDLNPKYINLLIHYILHGQYEGRSPNKLLKVEWICSNYNINSTHGLVNLCNAISRNGPFKSAPSLSFPAFFDSSEKEKNRSFYGVIGDLFRDKFSIFDSESEILKSINRISEIEPQIKKFDPNRSYSMMPFNVDSYSYLIKLRNLIGSADVLIFRDAINYGGADVVLKFLYNFTKTNNNKSVVRIISIGPIDMDVLLKHGIDKNDVVELGNLKIPQYLYDDMIFDIVIGSQAKKVYNLNCGPLWSATKTYGKIFKTKFKLYGFMFCDDRDKLGNVDGYPSRYLLTAINYLDQIYLDSLYLLENIKNRSIFTSEVQKKFVVFNTPVNSFELKPKVFSNVNKRKKICWAGRFDRQKRPDILIQIAKELNECDIEVWGSTMLDTEDYPFQSAKNIELMGMFSNIEELLVRDYDLVLFTSEWEGVPTIIFEFMKLRVPIVASKVGGVSEVLSGKLLVSNFEKIDEYVSLVRSIFSDYDAVLKVCLAEYKSVFSARTVEKFNNIMLEGSDL
jgi:glycosyltransferase involved in cell wall biosynthesis